jgi:glycosyltransferase involved in cell wall biosynthesis
MAGSCRGRVLYLGKMRHAQLLPVLQHARAVVLPSRMDNLPNTCIEAMAQGQVVIGTRGTSFEQLLEDGESGVLCDVDDPAGLMAAIETVLHDPAMARTMGERARLRVERLAGPEPLQQLLALYSRILENRQE